MIFFTDLELDPGLLRLSSKIQMMWKFEKLVDAEFKYK